MSDLQDQITRYWTRYEVNHTNRAKDAEVKIEILEDKERESETAVADPDAGGARKLSRPPE